MSYQVLARKWRPRNFSELMGQEHVVRALTGGLKEGRLHHAFLFTGTRGVGKTTIARIIAKALNCEIGVSATPCGQCGSCRDIDAGRFPDLIEIDAASRTKVDDTREILDNVIYAPSRGRFKVYLIDEVHMLSTHSFNALLKTLEEPPEHVKFLLATTDPQKLPVTVLSRCLKFHLKRLSIAQIALQMRHILAAEEIVFEEGAIDEIARSADGSMRDGLSLLDQALAFGAGKVETVATREMLGTISREAVIELLEALASGSAQILSEKIAALADFGGSYVQVLARMMEQLHQLAFLQVVGAHAKQLSDVPPRLAELVHKFSAEDLQIKFQFANLGAKEVASAPDARIAFEMCMLRMLAFADVEDPGALESGDSGQGKASGSEAGRSSSATLEPSNSASLATDTIAEVDAIEMSSVTKHVKHESGFSLPSAPTRAADTNGAWAQAMQALTAESSPPKKIPEQSIESAQQQPPAFALEPLVEARENGQDEDPVEDLSASLSAYLDDQQAHNPPEHADASSTDLADRWRALVVALPLVAGPLREFARNAVARSWQHGALNLTVDAAHLGMAGEPNIQALRRAIEQHLGREIALNVLVEDADLSASPASALAREYAEKAQEFIDSMANRPLIRALIQQLDARIVPGSVQFSSSPHAMSY